MTPFECFQEYVALKAHFTGRYDYFKWQGKLNLPMVAYESRHDRKMFCRLAKLPEVVIKQSLLATWVLMRGTDWWIGEWTLPELQEHRDAWNGRLQAWGYRFQRDVALIAEHLDAGLLLWEQRDGHRPLVLAMYSTGEIDAETAAIIATWSGCTIKGWQDDYLTAPTIAFLLKYYPFIPHDKAKAGTILLSRLGACAKMQKSDFVMNKVIQPNIANT